MFSDASEGKPKKGSGGGLFGLFRTTAAADGEAAAGEREASRQRSSVDHSQFRQFSYVAPEFGGEGPGEATGSRK